MKKRLLLSTLMVGIVATSAQAGDIQECGKLLSNSPDVEYIDLTSLNQDQVKKVVSPIIVHSADILNFLVSKKSVSIKNIDCKNVHFHFFDNKGPDSTTLGVIDGKSLFTLELKPRT